MYVQLVLVALLAISGLAGPAPSAQDSSAPQERVVSQTVTGASTVTADPAPPVAPPPAVSLKNVDIVVPPVQPSGTVAAPNAPLEAQAAPGVVVADQLVAPKRVESEVVKATGFQMLGVSWPKNASVGDLGSQFRTRTNGKWSGWVALEPTDAAPDPGSADAAHAVRGGTDPVSIGSADAVQLAFTASAKGGPKGMSLALIDSPQKPASDGVVVSNAVYSTAGGSTAATEATIQTVAFSGAAVQAAATAPRIISRAAWGAPAQRCTPDVAPTLVGATVHHTAGPNTYTTIAGAEAQIRGDAAFHLSLGWCDLGYNFVVDKWGNIYEGRKNSMTQAVVGAHAGGFNTGTVGVAMLGTYTAAPSAAMQQGVAQIIGWRLGAYGVDTKGSMTYHTGDGGVGVKFKNQNVVLPRVFGHRDVWFTACPGNGGYAALPNIRVMASSFGYALRFTQARSVVSALYQDLLLRPVDPSGLQAWSAMLAGGVAQPALVASLTKSREYVQLRVTQAYRNVLGRAPDAGGLAAWSREILAGRIPVDDVQRQFYTYQEFYLRSGGTPGGYVANLYQVILGRPAAPGDIAVWAANLNPRSTVVNSVWFSMEAALGRAGTYYQLFLQRPADPGGKVTWANVLLKQGEGAVRVGMAGSGEYRLLALKRFP
jgi:N-acetylmuramoyl-L-alanine amidase